MHPEKRKCKRSDIFLIIHFRTIHDSDGYALGIFRNYSDDGFSLESHNFSYKPGQILECTIRHPGSSASLSILGEIVWKKDGWYDSAMGIKFLDMDECHLNALREVADAGQMENAAIDSEDSALSTTQENHIQKIIGDTASHDIAGSRALSPERKTDTPSRGKSSPKPRSSYFFFFLFIVLIVVIIFGVAVQDGKDIFPAVTLYELNTESPVQGQNSTAAAAAASDNTPAVYENDPKFAPAEKTQAADRPNAAALPKEIIRDEITFDANSTDISSQFYPVIDKVADILLANPGLTVKLEGHTDSAGSEIYNLDLSIRRAAAVRNELMNKGILSSRIKIICFGHSNPAASNDVESGRMKNRRVEISIPLSHS